MSTPPNVVEPYTNLGLVEWPETNYEPPVSLNSAAAFASESKEESSEPPVSRNSASGKQSRNYVEESATPSGNSSSANNSSVSTFTKLPGIPQGSFLSPSQFMRERTPVAVSGNNSSASNSAAAPSSSSPLDRAVEEYEPRKYAIDNLREKVAAVLGSERRSIKIGVVARNLNNLAEPVSTTTWNRFITSNRKKIKVLVSSLFYKKPINYARGSFAIEKSSNKVEVIPGVIKRFDDMDDDMDKDKDLDDFKLELTHRITTDKEITHYFIYINTDLPVNPETNVKLLELLDHIGRYLTFAFQMLGIDIVDKDSKLGGARRKSRKSRKSRSGRKTKSRKSHRRR